MRAATNGTLRRFGGAPGRLSRPGHVAEPNRGRPWRGGTCPDPVMPGRPQPEVVSALLMLANAAVRLHNVAEISRHATKRVLYQQL